MSPEPEPTPVNPRPKNLTHLMIGMIAQLGLLVMASGFELLVQVAVAEVRGYGRITVHWAMFLVFTGLAVWFGYWALDLWRGRRLAFRMTAFVLVAEAVVLVGIFISGDVTSTCVGAAMIGAAVIAVFCGRLLLLPDVTAYGDGGRQS